MDGPVLHCGIGPVPCGNGTVESKTTPAVRKVFVPAIVSKCLTMIWRPRAVIISVSQGHDIVAVPSNDDEYFLFVVQSLSHGIFCNKNSSENILTIESRKQHRDDKQGADYATESLSH